MECFICGLEVGFEYRCHLCGVQTNNIFEKKIYKNYSNTKTKIELDFGTYEVPDLIRGKATEFYCNLTNGDILKDSNRRGLMWMCCYEAFKHFGIAKDPYIFAENFNLDRKQINKALRIFWENVHKNNLKDEFPKIQLSICDLIPVFADIYDIDSENEKKLIEISNTLKDYYMNIDKYRPRDVAAAIVYWFLMEDISMIKFCETCYVRKSTMEKLVGIIKQIVI